VKSSQNGIGNFCLIFYVRSQNHNFIIACSNNFFCCLQPAVIYFSKAKGQLTGASWRNLETRNVC